MPPTATLEDIRAYQERVEKGKISPDNLPPCPRCSVASEFFKLHTYRERRFLIIVEMLIEAVFCTLLRFICPGCGKTFTNYPDFAVPHKHYTRPSIMGFAAAYAQTDDMTYQQAVSVDRIAPGYPESDATLAPSTIHRWVATLGRLTQTCRKALILLLQQDPVSSIHRNLARIVIGKRKYRGHRRRKLLVHCLQLIVIEAFFQAAFRTSIFTKLAIHCAFG
jgi:hypothetical protein